MDYLEVLRYTDALIGLNGAFYDGLFRGMRDLEAGTQSRSDQELQDVTLIEVPRIEIEDGEWLGYIAIFVDCGYRSTLAMNRTVSYPTLFSPNPNTPGKLQWFVHLNSGLDRQAEMPLDLAGKQLLHYLQRCYPIQGKSSYILHFETCEYCRAHPLEPRSCKEGQLLGLRSLYQKMSP
jgi:hypothetical protein